MKKLSRKAVIYIFTTILVGVGMMAWLFGNTTWRDPWMLAGLSGLASLSLIIKVIGTTNRTHYNISFLIYSFTFLLFGPGEAALVILVSYLVEWVWHKYPWYIQSFNIGAFFVTIHFTGIFYNWLNPDRTFLDFRGILAALAAMAVFTLVNHLMVGIVIWLARGENFAKSGIFNSLPLVIDYTLLCMGVSAAMVWSFNPYAVLPILLPLYLIYSTLRVPALERQTELDPKTGLYNARYFARELETELKRSNRFERPLTVVMGDLDLLRNINNTYGHVAGDQILIGIANILKEHTREYDRVCRFGGEEFAIMIPESTPEQVFTHIEAIRDSICTAEFTVSTSVTPIKASMSFGIACRDNLSQTANDIVHNADVALYHAKLTGRNRTVIYASDAYREIFQGNQKEMPEPSLISLSERIEHDVHLPMPNPIREAAEGAQEEKKPQEAAPPSNDLPNKTSKYKVNLYITAVASIAFLLLILTQPPVMQINYLGLAIFAGTLILTEWLSIDLYVRDIAVSTSTVPILAGVLIFGWPAAVLFSLTFAATTMFKHRILLSRFIFNASNQLIGCLLIINLTFLTGVSFNNLPVGLQVLVCLLASGILFLSTTVLISLAIGLDIGQSPLEIWKEKFSWLWSSYLGMGLIAYLLVFGYQMKGVIGILITLVPLYLLRFSQAQYIVRTKGMVSELREKNTALENNTKEINGLNEGLLETLAEVIDHRDPYVLEHSKKVAQYAVGIAEQLGLHPNQVELIRKASLMHDVGKLGVPEAILLKPGSLSKDEFDMIKKHPVFGAKILETTRAMHRFIPIVRHHHERYDGHGYPDGLDGQNIPIEARIVALADAVDAMASDRPYRKRQSMEHIIIEIQTKSGTQFDPQVVEGFLKLLKIKSNESKLPMESIQRRVQLETE